MAQTQDLVAPDDLLVAREVTPPSPAPTPADPHQSGAFAIWFQDCTKLEEQTNSPRLEDNPRIQSARALRESTILRVAQIVQEFRGLSDNDKETCLALVRDTPIFPGLVAYAFTHLILCPRPPREWFTKDDWSMHLPPQKTWVRRRAEFGDTICRSSYETVKLELVEILQKLPCRGRATKDDWSVDLSGLKERVQRWKKYGDTVCILGYETIRSDLVDILRGTKVQPGKHKCNTQLLGGTMLLEHDILNLAVVAALCVTGLVKNRISTVVNLYEANLSIDLFHALLEKNLELEDWYQRCLFNTVVTLSKETSYCPTSLYLNEGAGGFGMVYSGNLSSRVVAVKVLKQGCYNSVYDLKEALWDVAIVWRHVRHTNCLPFYGLCSAPGRNPEVTAFVSPWMHRDNLCKYLECNPKANRTMLILDVVRGLNYLHSMQPHVVHGDLEPDSILITEEGRACLAYVGLKSESTFPGRIQPETLAGWLLMGRTLNYMTPELYKAFDEGAGCEVDNRACDMYALGCTTCAAYTSSDPFHGVSPALIPAQVMQGEPPDFPKSVIIRHAELRREPLESGSL
ncbi:hypothetical protein PAXINDRAFT_8755 [Paxillus involutus ATCC 200175]|nr:hypothetical protein PAXINDRAFT_8755 [Paxillus involutus ATCC 200175]